VTPKSWFGEQCLVATFDEVANFLPALAGHSTSSEMVELMA
jgi:hypothetical protein